MEEEKTALHTLYFVTQSDNDISLEIITGGINQTSTIHVQIDNIFERRNVHGHLPLTIIGSNKNLIGRRLIISCTITDTSRDTNFTELRIRLNGGIIFIEYPLFANVENEGDSINYRCVIRFFNPS